MKINTVKIKQAMVRDGLRQRVVAERIDMHATAFSAALRSGKMDREYAERLAVVLKVPFVEVAYDDNDAILQESITTNDELLRRIEMIVERHLSEKLSPLVDQIRALNKLVDLAHVIMSDKNGNR